MKIKIKYEVSSTFFYPKAAHVELGDAKFWASAESWEKAKKDVIVKVKEYLAELKETLPEPEEVEI